MKLTYLEAYKAMIVFLEGVYERTNSDDIGSLLGGMQLTSEMDTMDPAAWEDWLSSISKAKS